MSAPTYFAYLLRLWRDSEEGTWRAMLVTAPPGERVVFATLRELVAYLEYRTGERLCPDVQQQEGEDPSP